MKDVMNTINHKLTTVVFVFALLLTLMQANNAMAQVSKVDETTTEVKDQEATKNSDDKASPEPSSLDQKTIDKLTKYLTGSKWTGNFTITGKEDQELTPETYEIAKAQKLPDGDLWMLSARIKYGKRDQVVDLPPLEIKVVGDAPMIIFDKLTILGMGTFDARVLIRNNKYAGTWMHDDVGGHLFGTIERKKDESTSKDQKTNKDD